MEEYRIRITGKYDGIVLSPKMIAVLYRKNKLRNNYRRVCPSEAEYCSGNHICRDLLAPKPVRAHQKCSDSKNGIP